MNRHGSITAPAVLRPRAAARTLAGLLGIALASAAPATAATTIGSDLAPDPVNSLCSPPDSCMVTNTTLPGRQLTAPTDGVIVRWRVRVDDTEPGGNQLRLRVIRPISGGAFQAISTSATQTVFDLGPPATSLFTTQQAVRAGDGIALDLPSPAGNLTLATSNQPGVTSVRWVPPLADGLSGAPTDSLSNSLEHLFNADIEADADCDARGDETQDTSLGPGCLARLDGRRAKAKGKRLALRLSCPLVTRDCDANRLVLKTAKPVRLRTAARSAKKGKRIKLGKASFSIAAGAAAVVPVRLTGRARKLLRQRGKVTARATVTGAGSTTTAKLKIRRK